MNGGGSSDWSCPAPRTSLFLLVVPNQKIFVVAQVSVISIFNPLLLHELELTKNASIERHEDDAAVVLVPDWLSFRNIVTVRKPASHDSTSIHEPAVKPE